MQRAANLYLIRLCAAKDGYDIVEGLALQTYYNGKLTMWLIQDELLQNIKSKYEVKYNRLQKTDLPSNYFGKGKTLAGNIFNEFTKLQIDLINEEGIRWKKCTGQARQAKIIRKMENELDLEETRLSLEMYNL